MQQTLTLAVLFACLLSAAHAADQPPSDEHLLFLSTFDDTTDVNLFGPDNKAGVIYTAESTRRSRVRMGTYCPAASIADDAGRLRDCLWFADKTTQVLLYQASSNLPPPCVNWSGSVSFWVKPDAERIKRGDCYPIQLSAGDWNRGGFFVRFPAERPSTLEFGAVSAAATPTRAFSPDDVPEERLHVTAVEDDRFLNDRWTMVTFTFEDANPDGRTASTARLYLDGELAGEIREPLHMQWMTPGTPMEERDAVVFLGVNYVGGIDDLRVYDQALSASSIQGLYGVGQ